MRTLCMGIGFRKDSKLARVLKRLKHASPTPTESLADYFVRSEVLLLPTFACRVTPRVEARPPQYHSSEQSKKIITQKQHLGRYEFRDQAFRPRNQGVETA